MSPLVARLIAVFVVGACLGSLVNWAIYTLAWFPRPISPWLARRAKRLPSSAWDRVPVLGWFALRREWPVHGARFWIRPMLLELSLGCALAALYWWEVERMGLVAGQLHGVLIVRPTTALHLQFASHVILLVFMLAASFIDIDEKIIPDEITVPGTLLGLALAAMCPISMLPQVAERPLVPAAASAPGVNLELANGGAAVGPKGGHFRLEPVTAAAPNEWPPGWGMPRVGTSLAVGVVCYWLWCFALMPRIWRGRRGLLFACWLIAARLRRELLRPPLLWILVLGTLAIVGAWAFAPQMWCGLLSSLVGLAASGGLVWAVRLIGSAALRREAMGFGDVTLMMMIGTFLGWQACLIAFFLAPFAGLLVGIAQFVLRRDDVIPYGPFLCLGAAAVTVRWAPLWGWARPIFALGWLVPTVLAICLVLLGVLLALWAFAKRALFGASTAQ